LLLGDGRAGKTTLAKRLQWETLTPAERGARPDLRPTETPPTHKMKFWRWDAPIVIPDEVAQRRRLQDLEERANARGVELPKDAKGRLRAAIRIWDFGGQEIYHNTHRVFAAEGSVSLLVWRPAPLDEIAIAKECPEGVTQDEWREYNRQRSLDYWLEYIDSMRPDAKVALVCTFTKEEDSQIPWRTRAPRHRGRDLPCFYVDNDPASGDENPQGELKRLQDWIAKECGREALRIGVLQPRFYGEVAARVDRMLEENDDARQTHRRSPNLIYAWNEWCSRVTEVASGSELDNADIETITGYLHDAGQLFWLKAGGEQAVIVAMEWATELIYRMLRPGSDLHRKILDNWGWLPLAELEEEDEWKRVPSNLMRDQLLTFMEQCGVLVRGVEGHESRSGHPVFVANEKWLLPRADHPGLEERIDADMETARRQANMSCVEFSFENSRVSEFMLRSLMASMGSAFGRNAVWYRNGFQAMPDDQRPDWCFRVWWTPDEPDGFLGTLCAVLVCRQQGSESIVARLEGLFSTAGPDLAGAARRRAGIADLSMERLFPLRPGEEDVGVSSSGSDKVQAEELVKALKASDLNAVWYQSPECRRGPNAEVKVFMEERLRSAPCMILLLSDAYLEDDPDRNWYCPWELADAIIQWSEGRRSIERTFVVYMPQQTVNSRNASDVVAHLFPSLSRAYAERYKAKPPEQWPNFQYYNDLALHFGKAWQDGRIGEFFQKRGTLGTYTRIDSTLGAKKFDELITALRTALAGRSK
jgi:GTPase SAR1 family protein